jgi:hypothetical protein
MSFLEIKEDESGHPQAHPWVGNFVPFLYQCALPVDGLSRACHLKDISKSKVQS